MRDMEKINILLVDDRPENLIALEAILEKEEYNLVKAYSGEEALKYLLKTTFALILMDVQMPGMDGFTTAKIIKARELTKSIPILFITANNMETEHIFMGYSVGAIDYILKPVDPLVLKGKVEGFVEIHKMKSKLVEQTETLAEQKNELIRTNKELSTLTYKLKESEAVANVINETSIDAMLLCDMDGNIMKFNPAMKSMFQYTDADLEGRNIFELTASVESNLYLKELFHEINKSGTLMNIDNKSEMPLLRKDESSLESEVQIGVKVIQGKTIIAFTIRDITEMKKNEELIKHMAYHDQLTNLPNRRSLNEELSRHLHEAKATNQPLGFLYIDMDRFKYINDSLGHAIGDLALSEIAKRLSDLVSDLGFVARVGGDEFNVILPRANREASLEVAEKIIQAFQEPIFIHHYELYITASIGLSVYPYDGVEAQDIMKNADAALYRAKELGKNAYNVFHTGMNMQSYRSFLMESDLRKAISLNQLELYYQPRVNIESGKIESAEVLLRWNHPVWGLISPVEFIPLAEETGQIIEIGEWVLLQACKQLEKWRLQGLECTRLSINFSPRQFLQRDIVDRMKNIFRTTGTSPAAVEIEITESVLIKNEELAIGVLNKLRNMGVLISIDDFGTGYSSLFYLNRLPVDILKIDRSFIKGIMEEGSESRSIISTIVSLAKALGLKVVGEGVETAEQYQFLCDQNCEEAQGFLFSPPVPCSQFESLVLEGVAGLSKEKMTRNDLLTTSLDKSDRHNKSIANALAKIKMQFAVSAREIEVFELVISGLSNKEISEQLFISEHTVKNHITRIFQKLSVADRAQAMAMVYNLCLEDGEKIGG